MRFGTYLVALLVFAAGARAEDFRITPMPDGGLPVVQPGFSFRSPGLGWYLAGNIKPENGVIKGGESYKLYFPHAAEGWSDAELSVEVVTWPTEMTGTPDLRRFLREAGGETPSTNPHESLTEEMLNGATCAVLRWESDRWSAPNSPLIKTSAVHRVCAHPDMPGFALDLQYYAETPQANAEIAAVIASLRFTPVPYHVREIRPGCQIGRLVEADGALWTICKGDSLLSSHGTVLRIDPTTNSIAKTIEVGPQPWDIAVAGGQIWVGDFNGKIVRIDPKTNAVMATVAVPGHTMQVLSSGGFVWVQALDLQKGATLVRIDPASASIVATIPFGMAACVEAGRWLFLRDVKDEWWRLDGQTGEVIDGFAPERKILDILYDGRFAWVLQKEAGGTAMLKFDPENPATPERVRLLDGFVSDAVWWNGDLCTLEARVVRCRANGNGPAKEVPRWAGLGRLLVFAGSMWVPTGTSILRLDPK